LSLKEQQIVAQSCKLNPKKFWKYIKEKTNTKKNIGDIKMSNTNGQISVIADDKDKCNVFVEYLSKVYTNEPDGDFKRLEIVVPSVDMCDLVIDELNIKKRLENLKIDKSPGPDYLHPRILRELSVEIARDLYVLFSLSISTGQLPFDWRSSFVTVLHKKGSKSDVANFRPISLTCIVCKVFESIIRDCVMNYFLCNNFFSNKQFGFIKGRSTVLQLLKVLDDWTTKLEKG
jgi:hypothetical protein